MNLISTEKVALQLGTNTRHVRALIKAGSIPAVKVGPFWKVNPSDLQAELGIKPNNSKLADRKVGIEPTS
jgi:excisionase family DNA binding protein